MENNTHFINSQQNDSENHKKSFFSRPGKIAKSFLTVLIIIVWVLSLNYLGDPYQTGEAAIGYGIFKALIFFASIFILFDIIRYLITITKSIWLDKIFIIIELATLLMVILILIGFLPNKKLGFLCQTYDCKREIAFSNQDINFCKNQKDSRSKYGCFYEFSYFSDDLQPCYEIKKLDTYKDRYNECVGTVAHNNRNENFCEQLDSSLLPYQFFDKDTDMVKGCRSFISRIPQGPKNQDNLKERVH